MTSIKRWYAKQNDHVKLALISIAIYPFMAILYFGMWTHFSEKVQRTSEKRGALVAANEAAIKRLSSIDEASLANIRQEASEILMELEAQDLINKLSLNKKLDEPEEYEWTPPLEDYPTIDPDDNDFDWRYNNIEWHYPKGYLPVGKDLK